MEDEELCDDDYDALVTSLNGCTLVIKEGLTPAAEERPEAENDLEAPDAATQRAAEVSAALHAASPVFEVTCADIVREKRSKYVRYRVLVTRTAQGHYLQGEIDKRYSEFKTLHSSLRLLYKDHMSDISFPRRLIAGNFTSKTIAQRSRAFEQHLTHLCSVDKVRLSSLWRNFFCQPGLTQTYRQITEGEFEAALGLLRPVCDVMAAVLGPLHGDVVFLQCAAAVCAASAEDAEESARRCDAALAVVRSCSAAADLRMYHRPLLLHLVQVRQGLEQQVDHLEQELCDLQMTSPDPCPSLTQLVLSKFGNYFNIS